MAGTALVELLIPVLKVSQFPLDDEINTDFLHALNRIEELKREYVRVDVALRLPFC